MLRLVCGAIVASLLGASAGYGSEEGVKRIGCYIEVDVPAKYDVKKIKIKDSYRQYVKRSNGVIELLEYPPVYKEEKTLVEPAHKVMRQVVCKN